MPPTKKTKDPQPPKTMQASIVESINKKYGLTAIQPSNKEEMKKLNVIENAIPSFSCVFNNIMMKYVGKGLPAGKMYLIYGQKKIGKTHSALALAKPFVLHHGYQLIYCDMEKKFDIGLPDSMGFDVDNDEKFLLVKPRYSIEGLELLYKLLQTNKKLFIIFDSITSMNMKAKSDKKDINYGEGKKMAQIAATISEFLNDIAPLISLSQSVFFMISQMRWKNIGRGTPYQGSTGGEAPGYYAYGNWKLAAETVISNANNEPVGCKLKWKIAKPNFKVHKEEVSIPLKYGKGFWPEYEAIDVGIEKGVVLSKAAGWFQYAGTSFQGINNFIEVLENDSNLFNQLKKEIGL